ncbi:MAG TPA: fasciclin domain-containing protein, partial [Burkholderiales bacterium]|nr:fasciclin domain-containing protein [Burkholderiales bacterium]
KGKGPFTVFAPTDEAFNKLPAGTVEALLKEKEQLAKVLNYHMVAGKVMAADVKSGKVKTVQGQSLTLSTQGGVRVDNANGCRRTSWPATA